MGGRVEDAQLATTMTIAVTRAIFVIRVEFAIPHLVMTSPILALALFPKLLMHDSPSLIFFIF
jgi:hypothetical protein